jgi:hypothetical protein
MKNPKWLTAALAKITKNRRVESDGTEVLEVHIDDGNVFVQMSGLMDAVLAAGSVLATGLARTKAEYEGRTVDDHLADINAVCEVESKKILTSIKRFPVGIAVLIAFAAAQQSLDKYKEAVNEEIDKQKDASGRYPCGHTDEEHEKMTDKEAKHAVKGKMRGHTVDQ